MGRVLVAALCVVFLAALVAVPWYFRSRVQAPCHEDLSVPLLNPIFHSNGSAEHDGDIYPPGFHFVVNGTHRGCLCALKPCIRKCCAKDEHLVKIPRRPATCGHYPDPSHFESALAVHETAGTRANVTDSHFRVVHGNVCRSGKYMLTPEEEHYLMVDGKISLVGSHRASLDISQYCLERMNGSDQIKTFVCFPDENNPIEEEVTSGQLLLYSIAMIISMPFLLATILVYTTVPELRNLYGKSLVCQCASLLLTYIGLVIVQLYGREIVHFWCVFFAFFNQFVMFCSLFWLNVMSFDIWWAFSGRRPSKWGTKAMENKRFLLYSLYAWGVPLILVAISLAVDFIPIIPESFTKPNVGKRKCWFADWTTTLLYFYLPSGIVLILNLAMFIATSVALHQNAKNHNDTIRFHLYLKLFIIMGLTWTLELLSFLLGGSWSIWIVTDVCNSLQGVVIFFIFVCKKDILQKLNRKYCPSWNNEASPKNSTHFNESSEIGKTETGILALKPLNESDASDCEEETKPPVM